MTPKPSPLPWVASLRGGDSVTVNYGCARVRGIVVGAGAKFIRVRFDYRATRYRLSFRVENGHERYGGLERMEQYRDSGGLEK